jgi:hypothetical protein
MIDSKLTRVDHVIGHPGTLDFQCVCFWPLRVYSAEAAMWQFDLSTVTETHAIVRLSTGGRENSDDDIISSETQPRAQNNNKR